MDENGEPQKCLNFKLKAFFDLSLYFIDLFHIATLVTFQNNWLVRHFSIIV